VPACSSAGRGSAAPSVFAGLPWKLLSVERTSLGEARGQDLRHARPGTMPGGYFDTAWRHPLLHAMRQVRADGALQQDLLRAAGPRSYHRTSPDLDRRRAPAPRSAPVAPGRRKHRTARRRGCTTRSSCKGQSPRRKGGKACRPPSGQTTGICGSRWLPLVALRPSKALASSWRDSPGSWGSWSRLWVRQLYLILDDVQTKQRFFSETFS
jgi:hypothetical protein